MAIKESDFKANFQKRLKKEVKPLAILQYEQNAKTVKGFPDSIVVMEGITVFIEYKKAKNAKFQPLQKEWLTKLNDNGHFAFVCHPSNADEVLEEIKRLV